MKSGFGYVRCREVLKYRAEEYNKSCEDISACGIIGFEEYMYLTANIEFGEQVDPRHYEA